MGIKGSMSVERRHDRIITKSTGLLINLSKRINTMSLPIPEKFHDLFSRPILCGLSTVSPNGQPHTVPVWCDFDGEHVRVNMPAATKKARNLKLNPKISLLIIDPQSGRHWIEIQGHVGELIDEAHG